MTTPPVWRLAALGATALLVSCHDLPSRPEAALGPAPRPATRDASDSPDGGRANLSVTGQAPLAGAEQLVAVFAHRTVVEMVAGQSFSIARTDGSRETGFLGLGGRQSDLVGCSHQGEAYLRAEEGGWFGCGLSDPFATSITDTVAVTGSATWGYSFDSACPYPDYACGAYSGSSTVSLRRLDAQLELVVDPDSVPLTSAPGGHAYTVRAVVTPAWMGAYPTPLSFAGGGWTYTPTSGADSGVVERLNCPVSQSPSGCEFTFWESGALLLDARVNGVRMTRGPIPVTVIQPTLELDLSPSTAAVGDTVIVTTTVRPSGERETEQRLLWYTIQDLPSGGGEATLRAPATTRRLPPVASQPAAARVISPSLGARRLDVGPTTLPACDSASPFPKRCHLVMDQPGTARVTVSLRYNFLPLSATKTVRVADAARVRVVRVSGPTLGGSFTTLRSERTIDLLADASPRALDETVRWSVTDLETDQVQSPLPAAVPNGATSSFSLPVPRLGKDRWPKVHPRQRDDLGGRALAYRVVASVSANGATTRSEPATIAQSETDVLRQEYIDLEVPQGRIPSWSVIETANDATRNQGDYTVAVVNRTFDGMMEQLQRRWAPREFRVNGYFRNPVHNAFHVNKGTSSGTVSASWHQYGCGADLQTFPRVGASSSAGQLADARRFWDALANEAHALGFRVEPRDPDPTRQDQPFSGVGHVHVEIRCND